MNLKIRLNIIILSVFIISIFNINNVHAEVGLVGKPQHREGLDFENNMKYKEITKTRAQTHSSELDEYMNTLKAMKESGQWSLNGDEIDGMLVNPNEKFHTTTPSYAKGGINSIPSKYKNSYTQVSPVEQRQTTKRGYDINKYYLDTPEYKQAIQDNLITQFDIRSPGSILTPEQWKNYIRKVTASKGYGEYTLNGVKTKMRVSEMLEKVVDDIFTGSREQFEKTGKTINPDFLIALSMHETGFGGNRHSRQKNSWFSMNATNVGSFKNAYAYNSPKESVIDGIPRIYKFVDGSDWRFNSTKGPSILGANTTYAAVDGSETPGVGWSLGIASIIRKAASANGVTIPKF